MANRFTVFDMMEHKGIFRGNPANIGAQDAQGASLYRGPIEFPKMVYHPEGKERIIQEGEVIATPYGPKVIMQQRELIWKVVSNSEEEALALAEGWHQHPAEAMRAAGKEAPPTGADQVIADLKRKIEALQAQQASLERVKPPEGPKAPNPLSL